MVLGISQISRSVSSYSFNFVLQLLEGLLKILYPKSLYFMDALVVVACGRQSFGCGNTHPNCSAYNRP